MGRKADLDRIGQISNIELAYDLGVIRGLQAAGKLRTAMRRVPSSSEAAEGYDLGHDEHQQACLRLAERQSQISGVRL